MSIIKLLLNNFSTKTQYHWYLMVIFDKCIWNASCNISCFLNIWILNEIEYLSNSYYLIIDICSTIMGIKEWTWIIIAHWSGDISWLEKCTMNGTLF